MSLHSSETQMCADIRAKNISRLFCNQYSMLKYSIAKDLLELRDNNTTFNLPTIK